MTLRQAIYSIFIEIKGIYSDIRRHIFKYRYEGFVIMRKIAVLLVLLTAQILPGAITAKERLSSIKDDDKHITSWNTFADSIYKLHSWLVRQHRVRTEESSGGYNSGYLGSPDFYREVRYYDANNNRLLSRIQWEKDNPDTIHNIEIFIYDKYGNVERDYLAAYLPTFRNAPVQTLINFHSWNDDLHAFRQFDASGELIYEQCTGDHFGEVDISLEDYQLLQPSNEIAELIASDAYIACFNTLPSRAGKYLDPLSNIPLSARSIKDDIDDNTFEYVARKVMLISKRIKEQPNIAKLYVERGKLNFRLQEFDAVVADQTLALKMDDSIDEAYYWRGMALGRQRQFEAAIRDLGVYLRRNPESSLGYTKRGVRYIWKGDLVSAERDLRKAIELNPNNAEAHDDLGVIVAQRGELDKARDHFLTTVNVDPSYAKGHQNLALTYFLSGEHKLALQSVNRSLALSADNRSALMLKSEILTGLDRDEEAAEIRKQAEFIPAGNWSEQFNVNQ